MSPTPLRRRLLSAAALLLAPAVVLATPGAAEGATRNRADAGAGWLGRQLDADSHLATTAFGPDYGLTADVVLALDSAKVGRRTARQATAALKAGVLAYTGFGDPNEYYAGAFAKLLVVAVAQGEDPRLFGHSTRSDLVTQLLSLECGTRTRTDCAAADRGRFSDVSAYGDFSGTISQSLALIGLERATPRGASRAAVGYLVGAQCANGGFPEAFGAATCTGSVDATGFAVQALVQNGTPAALLAAEKAGRWLARQQHRNGSFSGNGARNANSTALGAQALDALDRAKRAARARGFLRSLQVGCGGAADLRGAVRYSRTDRDTDKAVRATAQAVPALARVTLDVVSGNGAVRGLPRLAC